MKDGTTSDNTQLCKSCSNGMVVKHTNNQVITYCHSMERYIKSNVAECSAYYNKSLPSIHTLYQTAWILETGKKEIGFKKYVDWKKGQKDKGVGFDPDEF